MEVEKKICILDTMRGCCSCDCLSWNCFLHVIVKFLTVKKARGSLSFLIVCIVCVDILLYFQEEMIVQEIQSNWKRRRLETEEANSAEPNSRLYNRLMLKSVNWKNKEKEEFTVSRLTGLISRLVCRSEA